MHDAAQENPQLCASAAAPRRRGSAPERFGRMPGRCERVNENSTAFHRRCAPGDGLSIDTAVLPAARTSVSKPDQHHAVHALKPGMLMRSLPLPNRPEFRPLAQQAINHTFIFLWIQGTGEIGQLPPRRKAASKRVKQAELQIRKLRKLFRSASILAPDVRAAGQYAQPAARRIHKDVAGPARQRRLSSISQADVRPRATASGGRVGGKCRKRAKAQSELKAT